MSSQGLLRLSRIPQVSARFIIFTIEKLWGFSSERARHVREGELLDDLEAELVVSIACAVCAFLIQRKPK